MSESTFPPFPRLSRHKSLFILSSSLFNNGDAFSLPFFSNARQRVECSVHDRAKPKVLLRDKKLDSNNTRRSKRRTLSTVQRFSARMRRTTPLFPSERFESRGRLFLSRMCKKLPATSTIGIPRADVTDRQRPLAYRRVQDRYPSIVLDKKGRRKGKNVRVVNGQSGRRDHVEIVELGFVHTSAARYRYEV